MGGLKLLPLTSRAIQPSQARGAGSGGQFEPPARIGGGGELWELPPRYLCMQRRAPAALGPSRGTHWTWLQSSHRQPSTCKAPFGQNTIPKPVARRAPCRCVFLLDLWHGWGCSAQEGGVIAWPCRICRRLFT